MPNFNEVTGKQFLDDYNGKQLFKEFAPVIGKKMAKDVIGYVVGKGYCTQEAADALVAKFNELYDK